MAEREEEEEENVYREQSHSETCFKEMAQLWYKKQYCDVHLMVTNSFNTPTSAILAHRVVLAAVIPYFKAMFECQFGEKDEKEITLHNQPSIATKFLIEYAYTGTLKITSSTAQDLLVTADKFGLTRIVSFCAVFIGRQLCSDNCLGIREFALQQNLSDLHELSADFAIHNFTAVSKEEEFLQLSLEKVEELIQSDNIRVQSEEDVYHAATLWIYHDSDNRGQHADKLYDHIRFPLTSQRFLSNMASKNPYLQSAKGCLYLRDAQEYYKNPGVTIFSHPKKTQPRRSVQGVICLVGGVDDGGGSLSDVTLYNPHDKEWTVGPKMKYRRSRLAVALFQGELYVVGGHDLGYSLSTCEKYSPADKDWKTVCNLTIARRSLALVAIGNRLFAMGGYTGSKYLKTVEIYNPNADEWTPGPPMIEARSELAAVVLDRKIYAIGGNNSCGELRSVEVYDLLNKKWEMLTSMVALRTGGAACLLGEEIFVCGGMGDKEIYNMSESYDPETDMWEPIACRMNDSRVGLAVVSLGNMVYVLGGSNGLKYLDTVEYYDPSQLIWINSTSLPFPRFSAAAVTLSRKELTT